MSAFEDDLYRLLQNAKEGVNPFSTQEEDAGADVQLVAEFSKKWNFKDKYESCSRQLESLNKQKDDEKLQVAQKSNINMLKEIIPVLDDAYELIKYLDNDSQLKVGVEAMISHMERIFETKKGGVIDPQLGDPFDPTIHCAVAATSAGGDNSLSGIVISDVLRKGYHALGQVIRSAEVKVLSGSE